MKQIIVCTLKRPFLLRCGGNEGADRMTAAIPLHREQSPESLVPMLPGSTDAGVYLIQRSTV